MNCGQRRPVSHFTATYFNIILLYYIAFTIFLSLGKMLLGPHVVFGCSTLGGHRKKSLPRHIARLVSSSYIDSCAQSI